MRALSWSTLVALSVLTAVCHGQSTMTHSVDNMTVIPGNSVACWATTATPPYTVANSYWRSYTLSAFGITSDIYVQEIRFGVETSLAGDLSTTPGMNPIEFRLYDDPTPAAPAPISGMTLLHTEPYSVPDASGAIMNAPITVGGTMVSCTVANTQTPPIVGPVTLDVDAQAVVTPPLILTPMDTLVVELHTPDYSTMVTPTTGMPALFFMGSNNLGQTGPSYLSAASCGITEPTDATAIGFPDAHWILDVVYDTYVAPPPPDLVITVEWSLAGAGVYNPCTMTAASPNPNPTTMAVPGLFGYEWDSYADGAGVAMVEMIDVQVTVLDTVSGEMNTCIATVEVDNTVPPSLCATVCGDCSSNGIGPDILDALTAAQIAAGLSVPTPTQSACCDVDSNSAVNIIDALQMAQAAAGLAVTIMCP